MLFKGQLYYYMFYITRIPQFYMVKLLGSVYLCHLHSKDFTVISLSIYFRECNSMRGDPNKKGIAAETPIN